jgi:hypothetical protein
MLIPGRLCRPTPPEKKGDLMLREPETFAVNSQIVGKSV